ncbi:helix-turn-helix domain-containing protein [Streptomyces bobili]|uniref:helix-turn-helix domain-containing protein n=1 Tax=Streptomyces bobili TaxID=67280 RepID=UPI0033C4F66F
MRAAAVLRKAGLPYRHIAEAFGVAASTVWRWSRDGLRIWEQEHRPEDLAAALMNLMPLDAMKEATRPARRPRTPAPVPEDDTAAHRSALVRKDPAAYRPMFPGVPDDLPYVWPASDRTGDAADA